MNLKPLSYIFSPLLAAWAALLVLLLPAPAAALLSGTAELGYVRYNAEKNGSKELEASSFRHKYSLAYSSAGKFMGGRLGAYKGMLGYDWGSFDTEIVTPSETLNPSMSSGNMVYSGELLLDPKELPLRLSLYSRDTLRSVFTNDSVSVTASGSPIIKPGVPTDIMNSGTHLESGARLRLGIKSGMTNGYNAIFRHVPLLLLDYYDLVRKDDKAQSRLDSRLSRLAFVSLNKKDNWFHYRTTKFTDNISPLQSYREMQIQLGTVDETLDRRWIDFTNWIKLSTDIQFTKRVDNIKLPEETYDVNLFLIATRKNWELRNFNTFVRRLDHNTGKVEMQRSVPVYMSGIWGKETDWSLRFASEERIQRPPDAAIVDSRDILASYRINTFNRSNFTLSHTASMEHYSNVGEKTLVMAGSLSTVSTSRFSDSYRLGASYDVRRFDTEKQSAMQTNMNHELAGNVTYFSPSRRLSLGLTERISIADGVSSTNSKTTITSTTEFTDGTSVTNRNLSTSLGYMRARTTLKADWTPRERLQTGGIVDHEMFTEDGKDTEQLWAMQLYTRYSMAKFNANLNAYYTDRTSGSVASRDIRGTAQISYFQSKSMNFGLKGGISNSQSNGSSSTNMDLSQDFTYRYFASTGNPRTLLEATERFTYSRTAASNGSPSSSKRLTLGLSYYPWANLFVSNHLSYAWNDPDSQAELLYNGSVGLSYAKLQATLDYSYGTRDAKSDKRKESRLAANVKKFF